MVGKKPLPAKAVIRSDFAGLLADVKGRMKKGGGG
jgi:hypothetical protein